MAITKSRPTKKEQAYLLLGLILGALLSLIGNFFVVAHFKIFNPSGKILCAIYAIAGAGFAVIIIWLFLLVRKLLK